MQVDIEAEFKPTHDEHARQRFVSMLRKHAIINMTAALHDRYENDVLPKLQKQSREPQGWRDIDSAMQDDATFRFYSTTRYNAQEMCYQSVQPTIERNIEHANATAKAIADNPGAGGTLQLDPALPIPPYVSQLDVHLAPGYTHKEHVENDVAQGAVVALGGKVFTGQHPYRKSYGTVAESVSYFVKRKFSSIRPVRVLDLGTCSGKNLYRSRQRFLALSFTVLMWARRYCAMATPARNMKESLHISANRMPSTPILKTAFLTSLRPAFFCTKYLSHQHSGSCWNACVCSPPAA